MSTILIFSIFLLDSFFVVFFFFNDTATTEIYTLSLHDALPISLLQRIFLMSSLMLLLVWLIFFMVLIKLLPILGTISTTPGDRKSGSAGMPRPISYAVFCLKKKKKTCSHQIPHQYS